MTTFIKKIQFVETSIQQQNTHYHIVYIHKQNGYIPAYNI